MKAIYQSVFVPRSLLGNGAEYALVVRYGWVLIIVRWAYYSVLFLFRDYHGEWAPFTVLPFGLNIDTYALLQRCLALPFGFILMSLLALALMAYLRLLGRKVPFATILSILGVTFFLPFVVAQPLDQVIIALDGWQLVPVTLLHTAVLAWECWAAMVLVCPSGDLKPRKRLGGILLLMGTWILIAGCLWR